MATAPGGVEIWFTLARDRQGGGRQTLHRSDHGDSARGDSRIPVPLLYTGTAPELVNDTTMRARLSEALRAGRYVPGEPQDRPPGAGAMMAAHVPPLSRSHALLVAASAPARSRAQGIEGQVGRFYDDGGWDVYRLGVSRPLDRAGRAADCMAAISSAADGGEGGFAGLSRGSDRASRARARALPGGGRRGGHGLAAHRPSFSSCWGSWSAGAGYSCSPPRSSRSAPRRAGGSCRSTGATDWR